MDSLIRRKESLRESLLEPLFRRKDFWMESLFCLKESLRESLFGRKESLAEQLLRQDESYSFHQKECSSHHMNSLYHTHSLREDSLD